MSRKIPVDRSTSLVHPTTRYRVTVPTKAVPKGRPRFSVQSGHARAYTPKATVTFENWVRLCVVQQVGTPCLRGPVRMSVEIIVAIPASMRKVDRAAALSGELSPMTGGDVDNIVKSISDGMIGIAYADDKQIVELTAVKRYGPDAMTVVEWGLLPSGGLAAGLL